MTDETAAPALPAYLAWLPDFLFETDENRFRYIFKAWLAALLPSIALSALVRFLAPEASAPSFPYDADLLILLLVFVGPALETLLMAVPLLALQRLWGPGPAVVGSALLWGLLHSLQRPTWGLVVWWPFLIMSIAFLTWRRDDVFTALGIAFAIHALQNGFAVLIILATG